VHNVSFSDFEDALQFACAEEVKIDYIVSRNPKDFQNASIPVVSAKEMIEILNRATHIQEI